MSRHTSVRNSRARIVASAVAAASAITLAACSHQDAAPGAAEPTASAAPSPGAGPAFQPAPLGASIFVVHTVSDLDAFEKFFESGAAMREAGSVNGYLLSKLDDGRVIVHLFAEDLLKVQGAMNSDEMQSYLRKAGAPDASLVWVTRDVSVALPTTPPAGKTFSLYYKLQVRDFEAFKKAFEERDALYATHGVIGRGLHQTSSEKVVVLHFVAPTRDQLEELRKDPGFGPLFALAAPEGTGKPMLAEDLLRSRPK
jgi:hypothetical protein